MKPIVPFLVILFALLTVAFTIVMPAAELMPAQVNPQAVRPGQSPIRSSEIMGWFKELGESVAKKMGHEDLQAVVEKDQGRNVYLIYISFLGVALVTAAIAINSIGRLDSEEKTIIPLKK